MSRLRAFAAFWYDFVVGDDWRLALGVVVGLATTAVLPLDEGDAAPGVKAYVTGAGPLFADQSHAGEKGVAKVTLVTFLVIILMLLFVYRSVSIVLIMLAIINHFVAREAERRHPPAGSFVAVDGIRLHYSIRGDGPPVLILHGNAVTGDDYNTSGVADLLLKNYRVIIFDRPCECRLNNPQMCRSKIPQAS